MLKWGGRKGGWGRSVGRWVERARKDGRRGKGRGQTGKVKKIDGMREKEIYVGDWEGEGGWKGNFVRWVEGESCGG